jgi:hypothetical protein
MLQKTISILNLLIMSSLILVFEHIAQFSFFGFLYPWISLILISFVIYFILTVPFFFKKPRGFTVLLLGILFVSMQLLTATPDNFKNSVIFISFLVIVLIVTKNSDPKKLRDFIRIITYCCLANLIYAIYSITLGDASFGRTFRVGGLDQTPVLFGYNMLLGFWLVLINSIVETDSNKPNSKLDEYFAYAFIIGIFLSQSRGAIAGLIAGIIVVFFFTKNKRKKTFYYKGIAILSIVLITGLLFPLFYWDILGLNRVFGTIKFFSQEARFHMWADMLRVYYDQLSILKLLFGGGQGFGTSLIGRGVHSDHLKILFDFGIVGLLLFYFMVLSSLRLVKEFNIYLIGFVVSTFVSGIFYVNFGSITNSFSYILVLITLFNYNKSKIKKS